MHRRMERGSGKGPRVKLCGVKSGGKATGKSYTFCTINFRACVRTNHDTLSGNAGEGEC